jgi:hypothetical protein
MESIPSEIGGNLSGGARAPSLRDRLVDDLRRQLGRWEGPGALAAVDTFSCGAPAIDRLLPGSGLRRGMLVEWLAGDSLNNKAPSAGRVARPSSPKGRGGGSGAATLGLLSAREACREGGVLVVIDRRQTFYPPAATAWGIDLERLIVVHPQNARDELWAAVQALRSPAVAAMWIAIERLDSRAFRRLQLAAQAGRTLGVLMRPASAQAEPSWADLRLEVRKLQNTNCKMQIANWKNSAMNDLQSLNSLSVAAGSPLRCIQVQLMRCHSGPIGGAVLLEIDDAAYTVREPEENYRLSRLGYRLGLLADG